MFKDVNQIKTSMCPTHTKPYSWLKEQKLHAYHALHNPALGLCTNMQNSSVRSNLSSFVLHIEQICSSQLASSQLRDQLAA